MTVTAPVADTAAALLDEGSATAVAGASRGAWAGLGSVDGQEIALAVVPAEVPVSAVGEAVGRVVDLASSGGRPLVLVLGVDGGAGDGSVPPTGQDVTAGSALLRRMTHASGIVPQIAVVVGPCLGPWAAVAAAADLVVVAEDEAHLRTVHPFDVAAATGELVSADDLGAAAVLRDNGTAHLSVPDRAAALERVRELLGLLPANNLSRPRPVPAAAPTGGTGLRALLDGARFLELQPGYAANVRCGLGRTGGDVVGVVATASETDSGALTPQAAVKAARFVRFCDAFGLPVVTVVDTPGVLPDVTAERSGQVRDLAGLGQVYAAASVPLVTVVTGRAHGLAGSVLGARALGADLVLGWPQASFGDGTVDAQQAVAAGLLDEVVEPDATAGAVRRGLSWLRTKRVPAPVRRHVTGAR
ncbi:carboxyl transferase domain-containing protein [Kineococcus sp. SYSU DK003]|uniref:carboxyl transferase domain-containing protein n=1 Tax=Kineococcus sp. SYSU DK003 TaxID=3383124 RepID=UPI003D7C9350